MVSTLLRSVLLVALLCSQVKASCDWFPVCFSSFYNNCERGYDDSTDCTFNGDNSYDYFYPGNTGGHKLIFADQDYEISWSGDSLGDYPVRLAWHVLDYDLNSLELAGADSYKDLKWDRNFTEQSSHTINFLNLTNSDFPNDHTNMTGPEALFRAGAFYSQLSVSQPDHPDYDEEDIYRSDTFFVAPSSVKTFLETENTRGHEEEKKVWRIGVGVGVGVGVPVLLAILGFLLWRSRRKSRSVSSRKITEG
ncbi:hypothetical protein CC79DRAFT_1365176 [Sarocladium strictum]